MLNIRKSLYCLYNIIERSKHFYISLYFKFVVDENKNENKIFVRRNLCFISHKLECARSLRSLRGATFCQVFRLKLNKIIIERCSNI